jgi:hypothetical protein
MGAQNLRDQQKQQHMTSTPTYLQQYNNEGEKFVKHFVTGGEVWINYSNGEAKKHSMDQCILVRQNNANVKKYFVAVS